MLRCKVSVMSVEQGPFRIFSSPPDGAIQVAVAQIIDAKIIQKGENVFLVVGVPMAVQKCECRARRKVVVVVDDELKISRRFVGSISWCRMIISNFAAVFLVQEDRIWLVPDPIQIFVPVGRDYADSLPALKENITIAASRHEPSRGERWWERTRVVVEFERWCRQVSREDVDVYVAGGSSFSAQVDFEKIEAAPLVAQSLKTHAIVARQHGSVRKDESRRKRNDGRSGHLARPRPLDLQFDTSIALPMRFCRNSSRVEIDRMRRARSGHFELDFGRRKRMSVRSIDRMDSRSEPENFAVRVTISAVVDVEAQLRLVYSSVVIVQFYLCEEVRELAALWRRRQYRKKRYRGGHFRDPLGGDPRKIQ